MNFTSLGVMMPWDWTVYSLGTLWSPLSWKLCIRKGRSSYILLNGTVSWAFWIVVDMAVCWWRCGWYSLRNCSAKCLRICHFYIPLAKSAKTCWQAYELMVWASRKNRIRCRKTIFESVPNTVSTKAVQAFLLSIYHFFSLPSDVVCLDFSESTQQVWYRGIKKEHHSCNV